MVFGYVQYEIIGDNYLKLYREILNQKIPCNNMREIKGVLYFDLSVEYSKDIKKLCEQLNLEYNIIRKKGLFTKLLKAIEHKGLILGGVCSVLLCVILSDFILSFNILSNDIATKQDILAVLKENGVQAGSYIPKLNLVKLERELKQKVDSISWAGISVTGSTLTIDVVDNIEQPEPRKIRMPCNLIAKYDAVIDKVEVYDGQLIPTVGSAVLKGDVLVSGKITNENVTYEDGKENKEVNIKYVRSLGKIYGTFEQKVIVTQPYEDVKKIVSDEYITRKYLKFFDFNVPLFFTAPKGNYISNTSYNGISIRDLKIPIGINTVRLNKYDYKKTRYSKDEALSLVKEKLYKYEQNFFKDYEIKDVNIIEKFTEKGVTLTAEYTLYGNIAKESEFFIEK